MRRFFLLAWVCLIFVFACKREPKLPDTPEAVVRQYQAYYDKNEFDEARLLSTAAEQKRLDDLRTIINQDTATCICEVKDIEEPYTTEYKLVRVNGQWLIDAPEEEVEIEEDFMELDSAEISSFMHRDTLEHEN